MTKAQLIFRLETLAHKLLANNDLEGFETILLALEIIKQG